MGNAVKQKKRFMQGCELIYVPSGEKQCNTKFYTDLFHNDDKMMGDSVITGG